MKRSFNLNKDDDEPPKRGRTLVEVENSHVPEPSVNEREDCTGYDENMTQRSRGELFLSDDSNESMSLSSNAEEPTIEEFDKDNSNNEVEQDEKNDDEEKVGEEEEEDEHEKEEDEHEHEEKEEEHEEKEEDNIEKDITRPSGNGVLDTSISASFKGMVPPTAGFDKE